MIEDNEIWRDIPSLPEYEASNHGRVRRRPHERPMPKGGVRTYGGKPWFGAWEPRRARYIIQYRRRTYRVAALVCEAFHGPRPAGQVAMHINENSRINRPENLAWGTQKENLNAPGFIAYCKTRTGDKNPLVRGRSKGNP